MADWHLIDDPDNPAPRDGTPCQLRFRSVLSTYTDDGPFFLHDDGHWYRIEPPTKIVAHPTHWAPEPPA